MASRTVRELDEQMATMEPDAPAPLTVREARALIEAMRTLARNLAEEIENHINTLLRNR